MYNCPNCGAPIEGYICKYCGTHIINVADVSDDTPTYVRFKLNNNIYVMLVKVTDVTVTTTPNVMQVQNRNGDVIAKYYGPSSIDLDVNFQAYETSMFIDERQMFEKS
jgi:hypothetical protein